MSLGYQIGTIMRRTSTCLHAEEEDGPLVKLDDVEGLGMFIQVRV